MKRYSTLSEHDSEHFIDTPIKALKTIRQVLFFVSFLGMTFITNNIHAQTFSGSFTFGAGPYSFNYTIACSGDGSSATVTADFTAPPPGIVPQMHLGGGNFVGMMGPNPYTYTITGLTACDFNFQFWMAYAGGLFPSDFLTQATFPVEWHDPLTATITKDKGINLEWSVRQQVNNEQFVVENSVDGREFYAIDRLEGAGNSSSLISYNYLHEDPLPGVNYYRIRQIDYDGQYDFSNVTKAILDGDLTRLTVYPNPATSELNVNLSEPSMVKIYNHFGSFVRSVSLQEGANMIAIDELPNGLYILSMDNNTSKRFIKN